MNRTDPTGRVPPGQKVTTKFPVMTAGTPKITPAEAWTLSLALETVEMETREIASWDMAAFRALPQTEIICDLHCVTRWSKLDTRWRGVLIKDVLAAARVEQDGVAATQAAGAILADAPELPTVYLRAECDGDYAANLKLADLLGEDAMIALDYDDSGNGGQNGGEGLTPTAEAHGGPARLLVPRLYLWKSAKWVRRLVLSPYDRKGFWEKLGYHNYGDPWKEQRYRGISDADHRTTLDTELSRQIRAERLGKKTPD